MLSAHFSVIKYRGMRTISYCPLTGGSCNKKEPEIRVRENTFFLAEPFQPEKNKERREWALRNVIDNAFGKDFSRHNLRIADKEPKEPAIFCDICRMIQSSAYGIVDITGLNPNVLLELGMMFSLAKPVCILVEKKEEKDLKEKLPSDILGRRVVPYEDFTEIEMKLPEHIKNLPQIEPEQSPVEETKKMFAEVDPSFAQTLDVKIEEIKRVQEEGLKKLEELLKEAKLDEAPSKEKEEIIPSSLEEQIKDDLEKIEEREKFIDLPANPEIAFLRGNFHYEKGEYEKAIEFYDLATTFKSDFVEAWYSKGFVLDELGMFEEAITCYDKTIEIKPDHASAWNSKGVTFVKLKRWEEAKQCYDEALRIKPDHISFMENLSEVFLVLRNFEEGMKKAEKALSLAKGEEDKSICWYLRILALVLRGKREKAQEETKGLIDYLKRLKKGFKVTKWDFSPLLPIIEEKLNLEDKSILLSLISLLKGEISIEEFQRKISASFRFEEYHKAFEREKKNL
jgi:tetratricopeptide (TPR) repeat protein